MTQGTRPSIARRLTVAGGLSVAAFAVVMAVILVSFAERAADRAYDRLLLASAQSVADAIRIAGREITVDVPIAAFSMLAIGKADRIYWRVSEEPGPLITGYADLAPELAFPRGAETTVADATHLGMPVRVAATRRLISAAGEPRRIVVLMAETRESRAALADEIRTYALLPLGVVCIAAVFMIPLSVRQALRPVGELARALKSREPSDFSPVEPKGVPAEIVPLVEALDDLVGRFGESLERNRAFLADAAHQLRTPLASLSTMAEVAAGEQDPDALRDQVRRIHRNAVGAARITNQLLADAAVENRLQTGLREPFRLDRLVAEAVNDAVGFSGGPPIRFDVTEAGEAAVVLGDDVALREAIRNLIENARVHGGGGPVAVTVDRPTPAAAVVAVEDGGPGIPREDRERVLGRFERGDPGRRDGSGLGLSIVLRVATAMGGSVLLLDRDGGGLRAEIRLPAAEGQG